METQTITIRVDTDLAQVYHAASDQDRARLRRLVSRWLRDLDDRKRPGDVAEVQQAVAVQDALSRKAPGTGQDSTDDIRRWREAR